MTTELPGELTSKTNRALTLTTLKVQLYHVYRTLKIYFISIDFSNFNVPDDFKSVHG